MQDREILRRTPSAIAVINTRLDKYKQDKRKKYFVIANEEYSNNRDKLYYKSEAARRLLAVAIKHYIGGVQEEDGYYYYDYIVPANVKSYLIPKRLYLLSGGGYYTGILDPLEEDFYDEYDDFDYGDIEVEDYKEEIIDILLYSPFTGNYELCKVTHDMTYGDSYIDISLFRQFVYRYGNPGIELIAYNTSGKPNGLAARSILSAYGYTVAQKAHLSAKERQNLLAEIVDLKLLSINQIVALLELQINTKKKRYPIASKKYEEDRDFIKSYKADPERFLRGHV